MKRQRKSRGARAKFMEEEANATAEGAAAAEQQPVFLPDLQLSAFSHQLQVLQLRAAEIDDPTPEEMLAQAVTTMKLDAQQTESQPELDVECGTEGFDPDFALESMPSPVAATAMPGMIGAEPLASPGVRHQASVHDSDPGYIPDPSSPQSGLRSASPPPVAHTAPRRMARMPSTASLTFSYFDSDMGQRFLQESGTLTRPPVQKQKGNRARPATERQNTGPWNPRLPGELKPEDEQPEVQPQYRDPLNLDHVIGHRDEELHPSFGEAMQSAGPMEPPTAFNPFDRLPVVAEREPQLEGPHPNKRSSNWDIYGEPRPQKPAISQAYVAINTDFLATEGPTDRRVRTCSIAHKKNPVAPSVTAVRRTGPHAIGRAPGTMGAKELLGGRTVEDCQEEHWRLSSTMQGLGDPTKLVEVVPGACRFGPLRKGSISRMSFHLRNLDVDTTRYVVNPSASEYVRVSFTPGHLAPGMATKIQVELIAWRQTKIEEVIEIKMKAHIVQVPVTARILDAEEFDRLDKQSLAVNRRRIGRHREVNPDTGKPSPVELVVDEAYCIQVMGSEYIPQLPELEG